MESVRANFTSSGLSHVSTLAIDDMLGREAKWKERDMSVGCIDFQKAYDLVPHSLILGVLKTVRVCRWVRKKPPANGPQTSC